MPSTGCLRWFLRLTGWSQTLFYCQPPNQCAIKAVFGIVYFPHLLPSCSLITTLILLFFFLSIPYLACRNMIWMRLREHAPGPQQSESTTIPSLAGHRRTIWSESFEHSLQEAALAPGGKLPQLQEGRYCPSLSSVLLALQLCLQCDLATTDCFFVILKNYQQWLNMKGHHTKQCLHAF